MNEGEDVGEVCEREEGVGVGVGVGKSSTTSLSNLHMHEHTQWSLPQRRLSNEDTACCPSPTKLYSKLYL